MNISKAYSSQLTKANLFLHNGLSLLDSGFLGAFVEVKAGMAENFSQIARLSHVNIGSYSVIGASQISYACLGNYCSLAEGVRILEKRDYSFINSAMCFQDGYTNSPLFKNFSQPQPQIQSAFTFIGHDVWIGSKVKIKNGLVIGHGAVLEDGAVVTQHVPPYAVVSGNPAQVVRMRFDQPLCERLLNSNWYRYDWQGIELCWDDPQACLDMMLPLIAAGQVPVLQKGYGFAVDQKDTLTLKPQTWTLEQELQAKFGLDNMLEIFNSPEIKGQSLALPV